MSGLCGNCRQHIKPGSLTTPIMGTQYHSDCLYCTSCTSYLWNKPFIKKKNGTLYCGDSDCSLTTTSLKLPPINDNHQNNQGGLSSRNDPLASARQNQFYGQFDIITNTVRSSQNNQTPRLNGQSLPYRKDSHDSSSNNSTRSSNEMGLANNRQDLGANSKDLYEPKKFSRKMFNVNNNPNKDDEPFIYNKKRHNSSLYLPNIGDNSSENRNDDVVEPESDEIETCEKCMESLVGQEKHIFNEKSYHKNCYTCDRCKVELFRMKKAHTDPEQQGMFCEPCFSTMYGPKCNKCLQPVTPYMLSAIYEGKIFHKECFCCPRCKRSFSKEKMYKNGNLIICQNCF